MNFSKLLHRDSSYDELEDDQDKQAEIDSEEDEIDISEDVLDKKVSNTGAFWNICNSVQGVAILAMPYIIKTGGWWSIIALCIIAAMSNYTGQILIHCKYDYKRNKNGELAKIKARASYADIGGAVWLKGGKSVVLVMQVVELLFMATLYPIVAGSIFLQLFPASSMAWWIMIFGVLLIPNIFVDKLKHISLVSAITIVSTVVIFILTVVYCYRHPSAWDITLLNIEPKSEYILSIGALTASYSSQMYLAIIEENMKQPQDIGKVVHLAYAAMTVLKITTGVVGYLTFKANTQQVICLNTSQGIISLVIRSTVLLLSLSSFSLPIFSVYKITEKELQWLKKPNTKVDREFKLLVYCSRVLIYLLILLLAEIIPQFCLFLAVIGSISGMCLGFIFPCVFHVVLHFDVLSKRVIFLDSLIAVSSFLFVPFGTYFTINALVQAYKNNGNDNWL